MQFSKQEEDIYDSLVNKKNQIKETQVKYELTRPRKKRLKKKEDQRLQIKECDDENKSKDEKSIPPVPPPRFDSLPPLPAVLSSQENPQVKPKASINNYQSCNWRQQDYELWTPSFPSSNHDIHPPSIPPPKPPIDKSMKVNDIAKFAQAVEQIKLERNSTVKSTDSCNNYEPWNWRQQNYESWTPNFNPTAEKVTQGTNNEHTSQTNSVNLQSTYEPWNWRRRMKEAAGEIYGPGLDLLPPAPPPPPIEEKSSFVRDNLRKSKSILKDKNPNVEEKKKRVRMLFPEDTVTPI